ncbi:hypothetical protein D3C81_1956290 [compost metagenome]
MPAIMTAQIVAAAVVRQRNVAFRTCSHVSAAPAHHKGREPSAVQQQHCLFSTFQPALQCSMQSSAEHRAVALLQFIPHVDNMHLGQSIAQCPGGHLQQDWGEVYVAL